jgi:hypothetical protein
MIMTILRLPWRRQIAVVYLILTDEFAIEPFDSRAKPRFVQLTRILILILDIRSGEITDHCKGLAERIAIGRRAPVSFVKAGQIR